MVNSLARLKAPWFSCGMELNTDPVVSATKAHKYLGIFGMFWVMFLIVSTFTALKTFYIGAFVFSVGIIAYPFVYIFADIFTEVYGYRVTRKIVWTGFACLLIASILTWSYSYVPNPSFENDEAFNLIFRAAPLVALSVIAAFFAGEFVNSYVVAKMKLWTKGKLMGVRLVVSTFFGQIVDNTIAFSGAFYFAGWFTVQELIPLIASSVIFCTAWEMVALPLTQRVIRLIKYKEGLDTYDYGTNFNPFSFKQ